MIGAIPFIIPNKWAADIAAGSLKRFGTLLIQGNRIVGHVQEASPLQQLLPNPVSMLLNSGTLASSVAANIQLEQVKHMLAGLQLLSGAALAASVVGIGVSVVGFAIVNNKLNGLNEKLNAISGKMAGIEKAISRLEDHERVQKFAKLTSLLALGEEAWNRQDKFDIWRKISDQLLEEDHYYRHLFLGTRVTPNLFLEEAYPLEFCVFMLESLVTVHAARFQSLLLCRELETARAYGKELSLWYDKAFDVLSPIDIALAKAPYEKQQTKRRFTDIKRDMLHVTIPVMQSLREIQGNMATRPQLIQTLIDQEFDGYEYVHRLRQEKQEPLLILPDNTLIG